MNWKLKYSSIFLVFTLSLILASGIIAAADIDNNDNMDISDNIETPTGSDGSITASQTDNNDNLETKTFNEVDDTYTDTKTTSDENKLVKEDKNLKGFDYSCTLSLNPNSATIGSNITAQLTNGVFRRGNTYQYTLYIDNEVIETGSLSATSSSAADTTFIVPDTINPGSHTVKISAKYSNNVNNVGSATLTVIDTAIDTQISEVGNINGEVGNTIIPVTITDTNGNAIEKTPKINIKDGNTTLIENYPVENGVANITVPTTRTGDYTLTVEVVKDSDFNSCNATIFVSVSKAATTLTVDQADEEGFIYEIINVYENTLLTGTLVQTSTDKALANLPLKVTAGDSVYQITTDEEGKFTFKYDVTEIVEEVPLSICFEGNELYLASEVFEGGFDTETLEVNIVLDDVTLSEVNETTTITGSLTDNYNHNIADVEVNLEITGVEEVITVTTDSEGKFSYDVIYDDVMDVTVEASMNNQELYEADTATTTFTVIVGPKRTTLSIEQGSGSDNNINIIDVTPYFDEAITNGTLIDISGQPVADANIKILINGEDYSQTTDSEGKFTLVYNATEGLSTYTLSVEFEGNDAYKPAGEVYTGTFKTEAFDITVTMIDNFPDEILVGDNVTITGSATLQNNTLKDNPIVITIDNTQYTTTSDEEGKYSYVYTVLRNGTIPVMVNATFANANVNVASGNIIVAHPIVNIDLDEVSDTTVLTDVTLNGRIYIAQNNTGLETQLQVTINNDSLSIESDDEGYFTYTFTPDTTGEYTIYISYATDVYEVHNASTTINVRKKETQLVTDNLPIAVRVKDVFTISGNLIDETNTAVTDAEVTFIINDEIFTNTTDADGHYEYNYQTTTVADNNLYEVRFFGDNQYSLAKNYVGSFFDVEHINCVITLDIDKVTLNVPTSITGSITDKSNKPLTNIPVKVLINNVEYETTTNDEGVYEIPYLPKKIGTYNITVEIDDDNYINKEINSTFDVLKESTTTIINPVELKLSYETDLIAQVTDSNNNPVSTGKIVFKIGGKTVKDENNKVIYVKLENGQAILPYTFTQQQIDQNIKISAAYSGNTNFNSSTSNTVNITLLKDHEVIMTLDDITAEQDETITITTTLKDYENNINTGKVILKINGKTIKDTNGKVLYPQVQDGTASIEYTIPTTTKPREYTLTAVFMDTFYNRTEANATLTVTEKQSTIPVADNQTNNINNTNRSSNLKTDSEPIIINNDTISQYITNNGFTVLVAEGDTLDFQGTIRGVSGLSKILINKPVNIITSTNDGRIENFDEITFNSAASGSNVTGLFTFNTQFYIKSANHIILDNITNYVSGKVVGSTVGQTSIREHSEYITVKNSYFYTNDTQSSSLVFAWADNCIIDNCTIKGENRVGNLLYFTYYNVNIPGSVAANRNNTVTNCTIIGPSSSQPICYGIAIAGYDILIEGCDITYSGNGITVQNAAGSNNRGETVNITMANNILHGGCGIGTIGNATITNNTIYDNGFITTGSNTTVFDNTIYGTVNVYLENSTVENNTINNAVVYAGRTLNNNIINGNVVANTSSTISNNTITGTLTVSSNANIINNTVNGQVSLSVSRATVNNAIIANNTVNGNIVSSGTSGSSLNTGNNLTGNTINGNISLTNSANTLIEDNNVNGTVVIVNTATGTNIINNNINTTNNYAITVQNRLTTISNNTLIANGKLGNDAISVVAGTTVTDNGPLPTDFWKVSVDSTEAIVGESMTITVNIVDELEGISIDEGEIYLLVNDEIVTDNQGNTLKADIDDSKAEITIDAISFDWLRSDAAFSVLYTNDEITFTAPITLSINKRTATVEITTEDLTVSSGNSIILKAKVTDNDELLNGKLAFKLDGCSLEDSQGNLICLDVVDGIATLEYTFDDSTTPCSYTLSAVFENAYYQRSVDSKTLIME